MVDMFGSSLSRTVIIQSIVLHCKLRDASLM